MKGKIGRNEIEVYDSSDKMPMAVFQRFNLYVAIDANIGGDMDAVYRRMSRMRGFFEIGKNKEGLGELDNMMQALVFVITKNNPEMMSFASLVYKVNGVPVRVRSEEEVLEMVERLKEMGMTMGQMRKMLKAVKKKLMMNLPFSSLKRERVQE
jgi:hypothetical protein